MWKIYYCPQCGALKEDFSDVSLASAHCLECDPNCIPFTKKYKNAKMIQTNHKINDWSRKKGEPITAFNFTPTIYQFFWETYIDIPENDKLNRDLFETNKKELMEFFNNGGYRGYTIDLRDNKPSKDASIVGRAVAGAVIAGPTGAIVGAASAIDKNVKNRK